MFTIDLRAFRKTLNIAAAIIGPSRRNIAPFSPYNRAVLLEADEAGRVSLQVTNTETSMRCRPPGCTAASAGQLCLDIDVLKSALKSVPGLLTLTPNLAIRSCEVQSAAGGETWAHLMLDPARFPRALTAPLGTACPAWDVDAGVLVWAIGAVLPACDPTSVRYQLGGAHLQFEDETLICTGTDGCRLHEASLDCRLLRGVPDPSPRPNPAPTINAQTFKVLAGLIHQARAASVQIAWRPKPPHPENVQFHPDVPAALTFRVPGALLRYQPPVGCFPLTGDIWPPGNQRVAVRIESGAALADWCIEADLRATVLQKATKAVARTPVEFRFTRGQLTLTLHNGPRVVWTESRPWRYRGPTAWFSANPGYLASALIHCGDRRAAQFYLTPGAWPVVIQYPGFRAAVMPCGPERSKCTIMFEGVAPVL